MKKARFLATGFVLALLTTFATPALIDGNASAASQITTRSIQLSNSIPGATGVTYNVTFTPATTQAATAGIIIDFCSDNPIIGASCAFAATTVPNVASAASSTGTFATVGSGTPTHTVKITALSLTSGTPFNFQLTNMTNPSTATSFYARILTYSSAANAGGYVPANTTGNATTTGTFLDSGGDALSTANAVAVTITVAETLTFCVSGATITGTCGGLTTPTLAIGTGSPPVLTTAGQSVPAYTQVTTNAVSGANVRMKATNACTNGGLSTAPPDIAGGCASIPGIGSTAAVLTAGTWGVCVAPGAGVTAIANYLDSINSCPTTFNATSKFGMNGANVTGTFGDSIYSTAAPVNAISSILNFAAKSATTTPAGVYQGNEILIATGTF